MEKNLGDCAICDRKNEERLPVRVGGEMKFVCLNHGATTSAVFDAISADLYRRVRIHKDLNGFYISMMFRMHHGSYRTVTGGRKNFKNYSTVLRRATVFLSQSND